MFLSAVDTFSERIPVCPAEATYYRPMYRYLVSVYMTPEMPKI